MKIKERDANGQGSVPTRKTNPDVKNGRTKKKERGGKKTRKQITKNQRHLEVSRKVPDAPTMQAMGSTARILTQTERGDAATENQKKIGRNKKKG